jgi:deoxyguanosine kinase
MLIAVEGCLGAGKTTVAKGLATYRRSQFLLEDFESNPFLRAFYDDPTHNAVETEFAFLMLHFHQLKNHANAQTETVADFHLGKDLLYAELNLRGARAKQIFASLYRLCLESVPVPSVLIFLSAPTDLLVERIRARNREFELSIDERYYAAVNAAYESFFASYSGKKIRVSMYEWDFIKEPGCFKKLSALVDVQLA